MVGPVNTVMGDCLGQVNHFRTKPASLVNSAFYPPWDGKMSISFWAE